MVISSISKGSYYMLCPHCNEEFNIPVHVTQHIDEHNGVPFVSTPCCSKGVWIRSVETYEVKPAYCPASEDNWEKKTVSSLV